MSKIRLSVKPPIIIPWLSAKKRKQNVILLDLDADREDDGTLRLDLNVVFNPIAVRRGTVRRVDYYVGSTGAEISIKATRGTICDHTQAVTLPVNYTNVTKKQRKVALSLIPTVKAKTGSDEIEAQAGSITRDVGDERSFTVTFASEERFLAPVLMGDTIKWVITLPRGEKAIRDFLIGNLYLFAKCAWVKPKKSGYISVRPSDVQFFDPARKPIETWRSLLMSYILWENRIKIENWNGFKIYFEGILS